jgi:hypothetical protein
VSIPDTEIVFEHGEVRKRGGGSLQPAERDWLAAQAGVDPFTDDLTLAHALIETVREIREESEPAPVPPADPGNGPGVTIDRAALSSLQARAAAGDRLVVAIGKLVGVDSTDPDRGQGHRGGAG